MQLATVLLWPGIVSADPVIRYEQDSYKVRGMTPAEIHRDMIWQSPFRRSELSYVAETGSRFNWKYTTTSNRDMCAITQFDVEVVITVTLPEHENESHLEPAVLQRWHAYLEALRQHEQTHVGHAVDAAHQLEERISAITPKTSCRDIDDIVEQIGKEVLDTMTERDEAFDQATRHGMDTREAFP